LVAILDADKEGFLRSARSLTQTIGRAARNLNGKAIMYADKITKSMQKTMDETTYRREKQIAYNTLNNLTPQALNKTIEDTFDRTEKEIESSSLQQLAAEPELEYLSKDQIQKRIRTTRKDMEKAAKELNFIDAAKLRDYIELLKKQL